MKLLILISVLLLVTLVTSDVSTPLMLFGGQEYFGTSRISNESITHKQLSDMIVRIISGPQSNLPGGAIGATYTAKSPQAVVVMTQNGLSTYKSSQLLGLYNDRSQLPGISEALEKSTSVYLPFTFPFSSDSVYRSALPAAERSTLSVSSSSSCNEMTQFITNSIHASAGKKLIFINADDLNTIHTLDTCLSSVLSTLSELTKDQFLVALQGNTAKVSTLPRQPSLAGAFQPQQQQSTLGAGYEGPKYVTGGSILAIAVAFILFGFFYFGLSCMLSAQGPLRYPVASNVPAFTREY